MRRKYGYSPWFITQALLTAITVGIGLLFPDTAWGDVFRILFVVGGINLLFILISRTTWPHPRPIEVLPYTLPGGIFGAVVGAFLGWMLIDIFRYPLVGFGNLFLISSLAGLLAGMGPIWF